MFEENLLTAADSDILCEILSGIGSYAPKNMGDILQHYADRPKYIKVINKAYKDIAEYMEVMQKKTVEG